MTKTAVDLGGLSAAEKRALLAELLAEQARAKAPAKPRTVIESLGVYLPTNSVTTTEILEGCANELSFPLERMTGIRSRRVAGDAEFSIDLARQAVSQCLALSQYGAADIDLLICANISRYDGPASFSFEPATSIKLRADFGFDNALVYDIANACTGMFTAIHIADAYLQTGLIERAMVVSGEYISHLSDVAQKEIDGFMDPRLACLTVGDAGAAVILERATDDRAGFHELSLYTLGQYSTLCIAKLTDRPHGGAIMLTDTITSSAVAIRHAVMHAAHVLESSGWSPRAFQHLIMHQTSETALKGAAREINSHFNEQICHNGNVIYNLAERGNTATTSHFVALWDNILSQRIQSGDNVVFGISGSGQTVGTALYTFDDLPDRLRRLAANGQPAAAARPAARVRPARREAPGLRHQAGGVRIESAGTVPADQELPAATLPLLRAAAEDCLARSTHDRSEIELLIFAGVYRDEFISEPAIAAFLAGDLGLNTTVASPQDPKTFLFDVFNGGLGFLNACHAAAQLIRAGAYKTAMVVAAEVENNATIRPKMLRGLQETASAVILDRAPAARPGFGSFLFEYATEHLADLASNTVQAESTTFLQIEMSAELEDHTLAAIERAVTTLLESEGLSAADLSAVLPPQISAGFVDRLGQALGLKQEQLVKVVRVGDGDYFTSSLATGWLEMERRQLVAPGGVALIINVGAGIQVGCALYRF